MTKNEVLTALEGFGNEQTKKVLTRHGAREPFWGVKVGDMKPIVKKIKKNYELALELYNTGNSDAMYFAGLIADESQMTEADLNHWAKTAYWYFLSEYAVAAVTAESPHGWKLANEWIESEEERIATAGWATLSGMVSIKPNEELDIDALSDLLDRAAKEVHTAQNRVRYTMNGFIIACGCYIEALNEKALHIGAEIGKVHVDVGGTACKVPLAKDYIMKVMDKGRLGRKRKVARC